MAYRPPDMDDLLARDATEQIAALAARRVSATELLKAELARHEATHGRLNAVVMADPERALERAGAIDDLRARGEPVGPLAGLPMTIKDTFDVAGMTASAGLSRFRARMAEDAVAVRHIRHAGAVIWGKTNVPVMAGDWQSYNSLYGTTNNPWDETRVPGGSSGGAAAAVAAGVTALEFGSDIGGSLRVPASFCGVFSHKPTWGLIDQRGHVPPDPGSWLETDLNVVGPLARSARDLRLLLSIVENGVTAAKAPPAELKCLRVGLWLEEPGFPLDPLVRPPLERLTRALSAAGAEVIPTAAPVHMPTLMSAYITLLGSIIGAGMPPAARRNMALLRGWARWSMARDPDPLSAAASVLAYTASHADWLAADAVRARLRHEAQDSFDRYDVLLAPATPVPAFPHDHRPFQTRKLRLSTGEQVPYTAMLNWISLATALHLPATTIPAGLTETGLPVGAQLIGPLGADARLLAVAQAIDENIGGFTPPPTS